MVLNNFLFVLISSIISAQVRNLRIGAMMRTVLPALAQAVFSNSSPNFYHEGRVENLKEKLQVIISASYNEL